MNRLTVLALFALVAAFAGCARQSVRAPSAPAAPQQLTAEQRLRDFDELWTFVRDRYCCFADKTTDWQRVREVYSPQAEAAADNRAFIAVLERALDELYDPHTHLTANTRASWRLAAYDVWAEWQGDEARILDVRVPSAAHAAGVSAGMTVLGFNGRPIGAAATERMPQCLSRPDPAARDWALRSLLSGRRDQPRELRVREREGRERTIVISDSASAATEPLITFRKIDEEIGYIRISSFADERAVEEFDRALEQLRGTRALVLDVRNNKGGDTVVSRPILGRFLREKKQYAWMAKRQGMRLGERWPEYVEPRGPWTYDGLVAVLVNHFSESVAEGVAMGLDGMGRATVVGTPMADLGAATARTTLPHLEVGVQISAEPVYHVSGARRDDFVPPLQVDLTQATGDDPLLEAAVAHLRRQLAENPSRAARF